MGITRNVDEAYALSVAGHLNAAHIELVTLVRQLDNTESWAVDGIRSLPHWLSWQLGISNAEATRAITVAQAFDTHPHVATMFAEGRLSIAQTALAVTVDPTRDAEIAELAVACTLSQLRVFAKVMKTTDSPLPAADPEPRSEHLEFSTDRDGWLNGRFDLDPEHGQLVKHALEQCRDTLFHQQDTDPPADAATDRDIAGHTRVRWLDAFVELARRGLDNEPSDVRRERYRISVFMSLDEDLSACWIDRGGVPRWLAERLGCDGRLTPTFVSHGQPVSVGRSLRVVPERTRRVVLHRDGHKCRVPWCNRTRWLDVHHIVHWADGGPTDTHNLAGVCDRCHQAIHQGFFSIEGNADDPMGLVYRDRFKRIIPMHPTPPRPDPPPDTVTTYVHPLGERLDHREVLVDPTRVA